MSGSFGKPRPPRSAWRRILRLFVWIFVLLVLFIALAPIALQGYVKSELAQALEEGFGGQVEIGECELGWLRGATVERLSVKPKSGGAAWIEIGRARFAPSLWRLLRGQFRWHGTILEDVVVRGERDASGWIAPRWKHEPFLDDPEMRTRIEIDGEPPELDLDLRIEGLRVEVRDPRWPRALVADFPEPIRIHSPNAKTVRAEARWGAKIELAAEMAIERTAARGEIYEPRGKLVLTATDAPLADLQSLAAPWVERLSGRANGKLEYRFTQEELSGGGTLDLVDLEMVGHPDHGMPLPRSLHIDSLLGGKPSAAHHRATIAGEGLAATWTLDFEGAAMSRSRLEGEVDPERSAPWLAQHPALGFEGAALRFEGELESAVGPSQLFRAALDTSRATLFLGAEGRPMRGPGLLRASGRLVPGAAMEVEDGRFEAPGIDARFAFGAQRVTASAELDLDDITTAWIEGLGVGLLASGRGALELELARRDASSPLHGKLSFRGERFDTLGLDLRSVAFDAEVAEDGGLALRDGRANLNGGTLRFAGHLGGASATARPFELSIEASGVKVARGLEPELARVLPLLAGAGSFLDAAVDLELALHGDAADHAALRRSASGSGALVWSSAELRPSAVLAEPLALLGIAGSLRFAAARVPFRIDAGAVVLPPIRLRAGSLELELSGRTALDGTLDHVVRVFLPASAARGLGLLLGPEGSVSLPLRGHVGAPRFEMPPLENFAQRGLEAALRRTIEALRQRSDPNRKR